MQKETTLERLPKRLRDRGGNTIVEFALCALPLFALFLGLADVAFAVFLKNMLQSAVRDGVRHGVTYQMTYGAQTCSSQTDCATKATQANALGFLKGTNATLIKVRYYSPDNLSVPLTNADVGPGKKLANGQDLMYRNQPGNLIEVAVENFPWNWMAPLPGYWPGKSVKMSQYSSDVLQGLPVGSTVPPNP